MVVSLNVKEYGTLFNTPGTELSGALRRGSPALSAGHNHGPAPADLNSAFAIGIALNVVFVIIEAFYG